MDGGQPGLGSGLKLILVVSCGHFGTNPFRFNPSVSQVNVAMLKKNAHLILTGKSWTWVDQKRFAIFMKREYDLDENTSLRYWRRMSRFRGYKRNKCDKGIAIKVRLLGFWTVHYLCH